MRSESAIRLSCVLTAASVVGAGAPRASAIVLGTMDNFQDGTIMNWIGGAINENLPGGAGGASDLFLQVRSISGTSSGSRVATHNAEDRWIGNYITAGVSGVRVDMQNRGTTTLRMRMVLFGLGNRWTSTNFVTLNPGSGWQTLTFGTGQADLTRVLGSATYFDTISNVNQIMFRHDASTPSAGGEAILGTVGLDNITAVPGPGAGVVMGIGCVWGLRRRR